MLALFLVHNHVQRIVAISQFGHGGAFDLFSRLQISERKLDQWRARVCRQQVRLAPDVERHKCSHRRVGFKAAVRTVEDFDAGAAICILERKRDRTQIRSKVFVGQAGDEQTVFHECQVGDRLSPTIAAARSSRCGGIRQLDFGKRDVLQRQFGEFSLGVEFQYQGGRGRTLTALYRKVDHSTGGIDCQIIDQDFPCRCAQHGRDFLVDAVHVDR